MGSACYLKPGAVDSLYDKTVLIWVKGCFFVVVVKVRHGTIY